ncbi:MAG: hypothetical protein WBZ36_30705 [Candidatus Nitrosopolaris sp.]
MTSSSNSEPQVLDSTTIPTHGVSSGLRRQEVKAKSIQLVDKSLTKSLDLGSFAPIMSVDEFFKDDPDKPYSALRSHSFEQSPCYPIIGAKPAGRHIIYYCEICRPEFANDSAVANINLGCIEHHCKYREPDRHKAEILTGLNGWLK